MKMRIGAIELELTVDEFETLIASGAIETLLGPSKIGKIWKTEKSENGMGIDDMWKMLLEQGKKIQKYPYVQPVVAYGCFAPPETMDLGTYDTLPAKSVDTNIPTCRADFGPNLRDEDCAKLEDQK